MADRYIIYVDQIPVLAECKNVKGLRLRVNERGVFISFPPHVSKSTVEKFVEENREWVITKFNEMLSREEQRYNVLTQEKVDSFITSFKSKLEYWMKAMGVSPLGMKVTFKDMSTRWGSCTPARKSLSFNVRLALYPEECTDYVIIHELAHLFQSGHTPQFWALVEKHMPHWRRCRALLRRI